MNIITTYTQFAYPRGLSHGQSEVSVLKNAISIDTFCNDLGLASSNKDNQLNNSLVL